jgi:hypothetical protein
LSCDNRSSITFFSALLFALSVAVIFWCKTHNSSADNISRSLRFMMVPNHDLIPNTNIMRRRRAAEKSNCFACQNAAMRKHIEMMALVYAD